MKKLVPALLFCCLPLIACDNKPKIMDSCGDGVVDPGEECDGDVGGHTCSSLGHYRLDGVLGCAADCSFDRSDCGGRCGDNVVDPLEGEECDLTNLNGTSCVTLGFSGGALTCTGDCRFDTGACVNLCGNGIRDTGEACDDGNDDDGDGCDASCAVEHGWTCSDATPSVCQTTCQDGIAAGTEACDQDDFAGATCQTYGYHAGALACSGTCEVVLDGCLAAGRCGDSVVQDAYEACDGAELDGGTCEGLGYHGGNLACGDDCAYDVTDCALVGRCGDGALQEAHGESCDGADLGAATCLSLGWYGGALACDDECGYDTTDCQVFGTCGDGLLQAAHGESCDGAALGGQTCVALGHYDGTLACDGACDFDFTGCGGRCGDGVIQGAFGEVCDGAALGGQDCRQQGRFTGALACETTCGAYDPSGCLDLAGLDAGNHHTCAVLGDQTVRCWGYNSNGRLGDGTTTNRLTPTAVPGLTGVTQVSAGANHTCARLSTGDLRCWGLNATGQLGDGTTTGRLTPTAVPGLTGVATVSAGEYHTCALMQDGTARCWGSGERGQLGNNGTANSLVPVTVQDLSNAVQLEAGSEHTCARLGNHTMKCWGFGVYGQLGDGANVNRLVPVLVVLEGVDMAGFSTGRYHTCAITSDSNVYCWGYNSSGQLGTGGTSSYNLPVLVSSVYPAVSLSAGGVHTCAVLADGTGRCWGYNNHGQLGNNSTVDSTSPVTVEGLAGAWRVTVGFDHSCAVGTTGQIAWCWGYNFAGQLGDNSVTSRRTPVAVRP